MSACLPAKPPGGLPAGSASCSGSSSSSSSRPRPAGSAVVSPFATAAAQRIPDVADPDTDDASTDPYPDPDPDPDPDPVSLPGFRGGFSLQDLQALDGLPLYGHSDYHHTHHHHHHKKATTGSGPVAGSGSGSGVAVAVVHAVAAWGARVADGWQLSCRAGYLLLVFAPFLTLGTALLLLAHACDVLRETWGGEGGRGEGGSGAVVAAAGGSSSGVVEGGSSSSGAVGALHGAGVGGAGRSDAGWRSDTGWRVLAVFMYALRHTSWLLLLAGCRYGEGRGRVRAAASSEEEGGGGGRGAAACQFPYK